MTCSECGGYRVRVVSGEDLRDADLDLQEFGLAAVHTDFPEAIPPDEIWIGERVPIGEFHFLMAGCLARLKAEGRGVDPDKAYHVGLRKERSERHKARGRFEGASDPEEGADGPRQGLYCEIPGDGSEPPIRVYVADGGIIRSRFKVDYMEGGHGYVYEWIPKDEIWLESGLDPHETAVVGLHEATERWLMKLRGWSYDRAHEAAARVEFAHRPDFDKERLEKLTPAILEQVPEGKGFPKGSTERVESLLVRTKAVPEPPQTAGSPFTGQRKDSLGRTQCYSEGQHVPCGEQGGGELEGSPETRRLTQDSFKTEDENTTIRVREGAAKRLAARWEVSDEDLAELSKEEGAKWTTKEQAVYGILRSWAGSSGGPISTAAAVAVAEHLGEEYTFYGENQRGVQAYIKARPALDRATSSLGMAMYRLTQEWLIERGVKEVKLLRTGGHANTQPAASWTTNWGGLRYDPNRETVAEIVPAKYILSVPPTGFGTLTESEVVVLPRKSVRKVPVEDVQSGESETPQQEKSLPESGQKGNLFGLPPVSDRPKPPLDSPVAPRGDALPPYTKSLDQPHEFGCLLAVVPDPLRKEITDWALENVPEWDVGPGGREHRCHVTLKYGFLDSGPALVDGLRFQLARFSPFRVRLGPLGLFQSGYGKWKNEDGDVLYATAESPVLHEINALVSAAFPCKDTHPDYHPHVTLSYLAEGQGEKYLKLPFPLAGREFVVDRLEFSGADGGVAEIPLSFLPGLTGGKAVESPQVEGSPFTGQRKDSLGRTQCYSEGRHVPCGQGGGVQPSGEQPGSPVPLTPSGREPEASPLPPVKRADLLLSRDSDYQVSPKQFWENYAKELGYGEKEIKEYQRLKDWWAHGGDSQKQARQEVEKNIAEETQLGRLLLDSASAENYLHDQMVLRLEERAEEAGRKAAEDYEFFNSKESVDREYGEGFWEEEREQAVQSARLEIMTRDRIYRKGKLGNTVESWTYHEEGANFSPITMGEEGAIGADHQATVEEMREKGYWILAGTLNHWGQQGEGEVTLFNPEKIRQKYRQGTKALSAYSETSGGALVPPPEQGEPVPPLRNKALSPPSVKPGKFTGRRKDKLGRNRCYSEGKLVPCPTREGVEEKPKEQEKAPRPAASQPQSISAATEQRAKEHYPELRDAYLKKGGGTFDADGNLTSVRLTTDDWRDLFPEYRGTNAMEVHEAASYLNKKLFAESLQTMKGKGNNTVMVLAGGCGSGKSSAVGKYIDQNKYPVWLDQISGQIEKLVDKLEEAKRAGFQVEYTFVDRTPEGAWEGIVDRALSARNRGEIARPVQLTDALWSNLNARKTALEVLRKNPGFPVNIIDNNRGFGEARLIEDRQEAIAFLEKQTYDYEKLLERLKQETKQRWDSGAIPEDIAVSLLEGLKSLLGRKGHADGEGLSGPSKISIDNAREVIPQETATTRRPQLRRPEDLPGGRPPADRQAAEGLGRVRRKVKGWTQVKSGPPCPAEFLGWQRRPGNTPLAFYNLTADYGGRPTGSTVTEGTLRSSGCEPPVPPPYTGKKVLVQPRVKAGFSGRRRDVLGRNRCYQEGKLVPCSGPAPGKTPARQTKPSTGREKTPAQSAGDFLSAKATETAISVGKTAVQLAKQAGHWEHLLKEWGESRVGKAVAKLPPRLQKVVRGVWLGVRCGTKAAFATYTAGQQLAEEVAKAKGASPEQAARLRAVLSTVDVLTFKPVMLGLELAAGPVVAGTASFVPLGSATYLAYSTARDPLATLRGAAALVKRAAKRVGLAKALEGQDARPWAEEVLAFLGAGDPDRQLALLLAALDEMGDPGKALELARRASGAGLGEKSLGVRGKGGFTGEKEDKLGRTQCYQEGSHVPCGEGDSEEREETHPDFDLPEDYGDEEEEERPEWDGTVNQSEVESNWRDSEHVASWNFYDDEGARFEQDIYLARGTYDPFPDDPDSDPVDVYRWESRQEGGLIEHGDWTADETEARLEGEDYAAEHDQGWREDDEEEDESEEEGEEDWDSQEEADGGEEGPEEEEPPPPELVKKPSKAPDKTAADVRVKTDLNEKEVDAAVLGLFPNDDPEETRVAEAYTRLALATGMPEDATVVVTRVGPYVPLFSDDLPMPGARGVRVTVRHPKMDEVSRFVGIDRDGNRFIKNEIIEIKKEYQGEGLGVSIFEKQVGNASEFGFGYISTHAAGGPGKEMNGYYTWPRFGYNESLPSLCRRNPPVCKKVKREFPEAKSVRDVMKTEAGRTWWKENGGDLFNAKFDLREGSWSRVILDAYLEERSKRGAKGLPPWPAKGLDQRRGGDEVELTPEEDEILEEVWRKLFPEGDGDWPEPAPEPPAPDGGSAPRVKPSPFLRTKDLPEGEEPDRAALVADILGGLFGEDILEEVLGEESAE
jgi:hypothetical protein